MRHILLLCVGAYILQSFFNCSAVNSAGKAAGDAGGDGERDAVRNGSNDFHSATNMDFNKIDSRQSPKSQWTQTELGGKTQRKDTKDGHENEENEKELKGENNWFQQLFPRVEKSKLNTGAACLEQGEAMVTLLSFGNLLGAYTKIRERGAGEMGEYKNNQDEVDNRFGYLTNRPLIVFGHKRKMDILPIFIKRLFIEMRRQYLADCIHITVEHVAIPVHNKDGPGWTTVGNGGNKVNNPAEAAGKMWSAAICVCGVILILWGF